MSLFCVPASTCPYYMSLLHVHLCVPTFRQCLMYCRAMMVLVVKLEKEDLKDLL